MLSSHNRDLGFVKLKQGFQHKAAAVRQTSISQVVERFGAIVNLEVHEKGMLLCLGVVRGLPTF